MATCLPSFEVGGAKDGGHAAAGDDVFDPVVVQGVAGFDRGHSESSRRTSRGSAQLIGPAAIHAHAFHVADADEQDTDIIAAIVFIGKFDQLARRLPRS